LLIKYYDGTNWVPVDEMRFYVGGGAQWASRMRIKVWGTKEEWLPKLKSSEDIRVTVKWDVAGRTPPPEVPVDPELPPEPTYPVPNLIGLTFSEALTALQAQNINVGNVTYEVTSVLANDNLIKSQSLAPQLQVYANTNVNVVIYEYKTPQAVIPELDGLLKTAAEKAITDLGFIVGSLYSEETYDTNLIGRVKANSQYPSAGETWDVKTIVSFDYYTQKAYSTMPKLIGKKESEVWTLLYNASLTPGTITEVETADKTLQGLVKAQQYNEGQQLQVDTVVNYTIYVPNTTVKVPLSLVGKTVPQFEAALLAVDLYPGTQTEFETTTTSLEGTIKSITPASGTTVNVNSAVNYTVYVANTTTTVPVINGKTIAQATSTLTTAELLLGYKIGEIETATTALYNTIIQQSPASGQTVSVNSYVDYYLYIPIKTATVPSIVGYDTSTASTVLSQAGFYLGNQTGVVYTTAQNQVGKIVTQSLTGTQKLGLTVNYTIYELNPTTTVPSLVGLSEASARTALTNAGLNAGSVTYTDAGTSGTNTVGNVHAQATSSGTSVTRGTSINFSVWKAHVYVATTVNKSATITLIPDKATYYGSGNKRPDFPPYLFGQYVASTGDQVSWFNFRDSTIAAAVAAAGCTKPYSIGSATVYWTMASGLGSSTKTVNLGYLSVTGSTGAPGSINMNLVTKSAQSLGTRTNGSSYNTALTPNMISQCLSAPTYPMIVNASSSSSTAYGGLTDLYVKAVINWTETIYV
jgi:beta-lactam-binding protein with PASTA domain